MAWWNLSPVRKDRPRFRPAAETLEDRATPAAMTVYEATELQVMNQFRANPAAFANDLRSLYLGTGPVPYTSPNGYKSDDPVWTDIRGDINNSEATTTWRSGFTGSTVGSF